MPTTLAQKHFTASETWSVPTGVTWVRYLIVGGGSSGVPGSSGYPGAGGNGGHVTRGILPVTPAGSVNVVVGAGGAAVTTQGAASQPGQASSITYATATISAPGGEGGVVAGFTGTNLGPAPQVAPAAPGEVPGGMGGAPLSTGNAQVAAFAGAPGVDGYAGGGGGGSVGSIYQGAPGSHGGGRGSAGVGGGQSVEATAGVPNTGGGGGGGTTGTSTAMYGRAGGSGYVRLEYAVVT